MDFRSNAPLERPATDEQGDISVAEDGAAGTTTEIVPEALVQTAVRLLDGCFVTHPPDPMPQ